MESGLAVMLSRLAAAHGDPMDAFDFLNLAIRHYYDSGGFSFMSGPLAVLAALFDRLGYYEPAATISAFAATPSRAQPSPRSTLRSPTCTKYSATRPTNPSPAQANT